MNDKEPKDTDFRIDEEFRSQVERALEEYEKQIGLPPNKRIETPEYLTMNVDELRKKSPEQLTEAAFSISQYLLYIQREINKLRSWDKWAKSKLNELASYYIPKLEKGYGYNERELMAKNTPSLCKMLNAMIRENTMKIERLYDVPSQIQHMSDCIRELKFIALKREKSYGNEDNQ